MVTAVEKSLSGAATLRRLWQHLTRRRRIQLGFLLALIFTSAIAEVVSIGAVLPFLAVLTDPEHLFAMPFVAKWAAHWGITTPRQIILPIAAAFAAAAVFTGLIRITVQWVNTRLAYGIGADLSFQIYRRTLYQPYQVHVHRNSSEVISSITHKVNGCIDVLNHVLAFSSSLLLLIAVTSVLVYINPMVAMIATAGFGLTYTTIAFFTAHRLRRNGARIAEEQTRVIRSLQEGLGGIRDVLLDGTQPLYCNNYRSADLRLRRAQGNTLFLATSPRFAMEALGMLIIAALAYGLSGQPGGVRAAIPTLGALALGAQRVLPVLQQLYASWASIIGGQAPVSETIALLEQPMPADADAPPPPPLHFHRAIEFRHVKFRYAEEGPWILNGFDLLIPQGARVGFVGTTGSGKSTTIDLLMGLLRPEFGELLVDKQPLVDGRVRAWQRTLAHVPQTIYLADATLAENIAFGVARDQIDMEKLRRAATQAQIASFVDGHPDGYNLQVGERGVRLSGGQRQRIGIARALYKDATVLVFDEATSALDTATENSVMEAIAGLDRSLTVIQIAHRLSTLRNCDFIVEVGEGKVLAQGTYEELMDSSSSFRQLAAKAG